jgi:D-alanyl-lipoteichoic acid acyltransferase DltB (MBOAT superfamily)
VFVPFGGMRQNTQYRAIFLTIMAIALWHDISIPLVVFGLYHAAGLIGHRYLKGRRPPRDDEPLLLRVPKAVALVAFFAFSLPLMVIQADQIVPVYSALVGVRCSATSRTRPRSSTDGSAASVPGRCRCCASWPGRWWAWSSSAPS